MLRKTLGAIEAAKIESASRSNGEKRQQAEMAVEQVEIERSDCQGNGCSSDACHVQPYVVASFRIATSQEIHEVPTSELTRVVAKVIEIEGPVHREEIARRVTRLWGLQRTGRRIREAVDKALSAAIRSPSIVREGDFFTPQGRTEVPLRDRGDVECTTLRKPEMLPPAEICTAVLAIVQVNLGVARDEAITEAARLFGFRSTSAQLRQIIEIEIETMLREKKLDERNGKLYVADGVLA